MTDSAGELEAQLADCFSGVFRDGPITPGDLTAVLVFPTPGFERLKIQWSPIWEDPVAGYPQWGDLALLPIRTLRQDIHAKEAALRNAPGNLAAFVEDVRAGVHQFMDDLATAVRGVASHPMFSGMDCLTAFCIARPAPNDQERTRPELVDFAGARHATFLFPVRNLHDLGPGRKKARRYGWLQVHPDGLTLLLPEGERCAAGILGRNPTRTFFPFESLSRVHLAESEIRFSTGDGETLLLPGHTDPNPPCDEELSRLAKVLESRPRLLARLGDRYQYVRRTVLPDSIPTMSSEALRLRTDAWTSGRGSGKGQYEAVNCFSVPSPSTSVAAIRVGAFAHLVFQRQGLWTLDPRLALPEALERTPYVRKEDDQQVPRYMRQLVTRRDLSRSIDPHLLTGTAGGAVPAPFLGHLDLPDADLFAATRSGSFILLADRKRGLVSVNAADPRKLSVAGVVAPKGTGPSDAYEYVAANERLAVLGSRRRCWFFDLSDPAKPAEIDFEAAADSDTQRISSAGRDLADALIHGSTLFVASEGRGVLACDVSDPRRLRLRSIHRIGGVPFHASRIQIVEDFLFVFDLKGGICWVNRVGDSRSPLRSLGTLPFSSFAKAWPSPEGGWGFLAGTGEVWTLDLSSGEPAVRSVERCVERWGTSRQPLGNCIEAIPLDDGSILAVDDEQLNVLKRKPLAAEWTQSQESRLWLIGGWDPGLKPVAGPAPSPVPPLPAKPFSDRIAEKFAASLRKVAQCRPGFRLGSLIVDIQDGRLHLVINPACPYPASLHQLSGAVEASWTPESLFSDPADAEDFRIILTHPELSRPLIQAALDAIAALPLVPELSSGRVRLGSVQWGISKILFRDRRPEDVEDPAPGKVNVFRNALDCWIRSGDEGYVPRIVRAFEKAPGIIEDLSELSSQWNEARKIYLRIIDTHPELHSPLLKEFFRLLGDYGDEFEALVPAQEKILIRARTMVEEMAARRSTPEAKSLKAYGAKSYGELYDLFRLLDRQAEPVQEYVDRLEKFFSTLKKNRDAVVTATREVLTTRRIAPGALDQVLKDQRSRTMKLWPPGPELYSYPEEYWDLTVRFEELLKSLHPILLDRVSQGDVAAVRTLLEVHEVPTSFLDARGNSLMQVAIESGEPRMVSVLCRNKRYIPPGCLEKAILDGNEPAVRTIVDSGSMFEFYDEGGIDCHALAVALGRPEVAVFLKEPEPAPEALAAGKELPKAYPVRLRIAKLLISQSSGRVNELERTGLMTAAVFGSVDVVREILRDLPDLDAKDKTGRTALDWAEKAGHDAVVRLLKGPE
ncbi:MAG TPA: ankyrin repeat domain-containing protein [Planctomycetota bacterium]|nr:ankyrin repeat domain-containing protein [Planctomycetota bacterium]